MNISEKIISKIFRLINRFFVWHRLPLPLSVLNLIALRVDLRHCNLLDTETAVVHPAAPSGFDFKENRTADGSFNDLDQPAMGMAGMRFGRNALLAETYGEIPPRLYEPNPRAVSIDLLSRREFVPVETVNVLLAAWLQFMVHDWLSHGINDTTSEPHKLPRPPGDNTWPQDEITILRTCPDTKRTATDDGRPATYRNIVTHWWDSSQLYGSDLATQALVRSNDMGLLPDGKLYLPNGHLPLDSKSKDEGQELAAVNGSWWVGLSAMHTLFSREHNAVVDALHVEYPDRDGEWLFNKARLIVAALIVKIHATEWTPALLQTPTLKYAMRGSWWGALGEGFIRAHGHALKSELLTGIPGSPQKHHSAPYSITEEFTAVYRLHTLLPDKFSFRSHMDDRELMSGTLADQFGSGTTLIYRSVNFDDVVYSLGTMFCGAPVLHNYPNNLRSLPKKVDQGIVTDLATTDILRDRERGVPRYCAFRRSLRMSVPMTFAALTDNPVWQKELEAVYGSVDKVDLLTGTLAETKPPGFAISDTAFRIFVLMAGRRIKSDRFLTSAFTPDVYSPLGIEWVEKNGMQEVLQRHVPSLAPVLADVRNSFFPWPRAKP